MVQEKFSRGLKLAARVMLMLILTMTLTSIIVMACSIPTSGNDVQMVADVATPETVEPTVILISEPILFSDITYEPKYDIDLSKAYKDKVLDCIFELETAMASGEYTDEAYMRMDHECSRLYSIIAYTESDIRHYETWEQEYYYAAKTWQFFMQQGFSAEVTSALIGNMMIETSGGTLNIKPEVYSSSRGFYGLCQWSLYYKPFMANKSFEEQLNYLVEDMPKEFKNFGFCYKSGFTYEDFLAMEDPEQAAVAFAKVYERCGSGTYGLRKQAAMKAYKYFVYGDYDE